MSKLATAMSRSDFGRRRFGDLLVRAGLVTEEAFEAAYQEQLLCGGRMNDVLLRQGVLTEETLVNAFKTQLGLAAANTTMDVAEDLLELVPRAFAEAHQTVPMAIIGGRTLVVATSDPLDFGMIDWLRARTGCYIEPRVATGTAIAEAILRLYGPPSGERKPVSAFVPVRPMLRSVPPLEETPDPRELQRETRAFRTLVRMLAEKGDLSLDEFLLRLRR